MKGSLHQTRMYIALCPLLCCFNTCSFPLLCVPTKNGPFPSNKTICISERQRRLLLCNSWVKRKFSQVTAKFHLGTRWIFPISRYLKIRIGPCYFFHVPVSLMSLVCRSVVDVALILCNLDITLCRTALDLGVLWNKTTYSPDFLFSSLWSMKYPLIWQCWCAAVLPADLGQQAAHESSRCFSCLGQWKPYGPFFLHLLPGANVSTADIWMCAMQQQRQEKAAVALLSVVLYNDYFFFQSSL